MAERQKDKGKSDVEQISEEQRKKMLQEQAKAQGPAIKNEAPPKAKSKEELQNEVGTEASKGIDLAKDIEQQLGIPKGAERQNASPSRNQQAPKIAPVSAREEEIGAPPTYPPSEAFIYEDNAPQPRFDMGKDEYGLLVKNTTALPAELDIEKFKAFPGLTRSEASDLFIKHVGSKMKSLGEVSAHFDQKMKALATDVYAEQFKPVDGFRLDSGENVYIGSPINFMHGYTGVPVYIQQGDRIQLTIAYRSGSQGCWRRFAGTDYYVQPTNYKDKDDKPVNKLGAHYFKGSGKDTGNEEWQNLDHRIQKRIDGVVSRSRPLDLTKKVSITAFNVRGLGGNEALVFLGEEALQTSMAKKAKTWDIKEAGNAPDLSKILTHWTATGNPLYRNQLNAVVESENGKFRYAVSLTPHGMYVQYIEDNTDRGINRAGAPSNGVRLAEGSEWIAAPLIEYRQQARIGKAGIKFHSPGAGPLSEKPLEKHIPGHRIIFENLHTENSPFSAFSMSNPKLNGVYAALRSGKPDEAKAAFEKWTNLPPKERI